MRGGSAALTTSSGLGRAALGDGTQRKGGENGAKIYSQLR